MVLVVECKVEKSRKGKRPDSPLPGRSNKAQCPDPEGPKGSDEEDGCAGDQPPGSLEAEGSKVSFAPPGEPFGDAPPDLPPKEIFEPGDRLPAAAPPR